MILHTYCRSSAAFPLRIGLSLKGLAFEPRFFHLGKLADCCLVPQVTSARRFKLPLDDYPTISAINATCMAMDEFAAAAPQNQPDYES